MPLTDIAKYPFGGKQDFECSIAVRAADLDFRVVLPPGRDSEFRRRRFEPTPSEDRIFRCARCGYVYTDDPDVDRSRCSQCGLMNDAIEF